MSDLKDFVIENGVLKKYLGEEKEVIIPEEVTSIGCEAFYNQTEITTVRIPNGVSSIENRAFDHCIRLQAINIPKSVVSICEDSFRLCAAVEQINVEEGNPCYYSQNDCLISRSGKLIRGCRNSVIPVDGSVVAIGKDAFAGVTGLKKVYIPDSVGSLDESIFFDCVDLEEVHLPEQTCFICSWMFGCCAKLRKVNIPASVDQMHHHAFSGCEALCDVTLPPKLLSIGSCAFQGCGLTSVVIPDTVKFINDKAFCNCNDIVSLNIGSGVEKIGEEAFSLCSSLSDIQVSPDNPTYFSVGNCIVRSDKKTLVLGCKNSEIPADSRVTAIGSHAFFGFQDLGCFTIPDTITYIDSTAFVAHGLKEFKLESTPKTYSGSIYDIVFEAMKETPDKKTVAMYSIVKYAPEHIVKDPAFFNKCKLARKALVSYAISLCDCTTLEKLFSYFPKIGEAEINGYLALSADENVQQLLRRFVNPTKKTAGEGKKSPTVAELKATFKFKETEDGDGLVVYGYKGSEKAITIPAAIGKKQVRGVACAIGGASNWAAEITLAEGIEFVDEDAFHWEENLQSITFPSTLREIRSNAFHSCSNLQTVSIPNGAIVKGAAFGNCESLTEAHIPDDVQLEGPVFCRCTGLADENGFVVIRHVLYDYSGTESAPVIPANVMEIEGWSFRASETITNIEIPSHVRKVGESAFQDCNNLTEVRFAGDTQCIGSYAFSRCRSLKKITLPEGLQSIEEGAFYSCSMLREITIPNGVKTIGSEAFCRCAKLQAVHLPASVTFIGKNAFHWYGKVLPHITIYAPAGSYAEKYAKKNKIPFAAE